jgi:chorismate mutase/prephenate dehydrogenase
MDKDHLSELNDLRAEISQVDQEIFALIKKREEVSLKIGSAKRKLNIPDRDFAREKDMFDKALDNAKRLGLPANFAISLQKSLMSISLSSQEQDRIRHNPSPDPKTALVIGGAGRMGKWMCRFLADSGHKIQVVDKTKPDFDCPYQSELDDSVRDYDIIIVATPIRDSVVILEDLLNYQLKKPVVFDLASVKAPVKEVLHKMKAAGILVTSIHPMFGPGVEYLYGRHVIRTSLHVPAADSLVAELFSCTSLKLVDMSFNEHDDIIAYLLATSHLVNIAFVDCLKNSGYSIDKLAGFASTTFANQMAIAEAVFHENHKLYYEIQALNPSNPVAHENLLAALDRAMYIVSTKQEHEFLKIMNDGRTYLAGQTSAK